MVDADCVVTVPRQSFGKFVALFVGEVLRPVAEVHADETDPFLRRFFKREMAVRRDDNPAVFSGRRIEHAGEIQRSARLDHTGDVQADPLLPFLNDDRTVIALQRDRSAREGECGDQPELAFDTAERQLDRIISVEFELRKVESDSRIAVISPPDHDSVGEMIRIPPVADIAV